MEKKLGLFYNRDTLQDILVGIIDDPEWFKQKEINGNIVFFDRGRHLVGFNIINAMKIFPDLQPGFIYPSTSMLQTVETIIETDLSAFYDQAAFVIGEVINFENIPGTHLRKCEINVGKKKNLNILCGADNFQKNVGVVVALEGAVMPNGKIIKKRKIHGELYSEGMLCSYAELCLPHNKEENHDIICLPLNESENRIGSSFLRMYHA